MMERFHLPQDLWKGVLQFLNVSELWFLIDPKAISHFTELSHNQVLYLISIRHGYSCSFKIRLMTHIMITKDMTLWNALQPSDDELHSFAFTAMPRTSVHILQSAYEKLQQSHTSCNSLCNMFDVGGIYSFETYIWYLHKKLVSEEWPCWGVAITNGDLDLIHYLHKVKHPVDMPLCCAQIAKAIALKHFHILTPLITYGIASAELIFTFIQYNAPNDAVQEVKSFVLEHNIVPHPLGFTTYFSVDLLIWFHERSFTITHDLLRGMLSRQGRYEDVASLLMKLKINDFVLDRNHYRHLYKMDGGGKTFVQLETFYQACESFRNLIHTMDIYTNIHSFENWKWLIEHGANHEHSILYSCVSLEEFAPTYEEFMELWEKEPKTEKLIEVTLRRLDAMVSVHDFGTGSVSAIEWIVEALMNQPLTISFAFSSTFQNSDALRDKRLLLKRFQ